MQYADDPNDQQLKKPGESKKPAESDGEEGANKRRVGMYDRPKDAFPTMQVLLIVVMLLLAALSFYFFFLR